MRLKALIVLAVLAATLSSCRDDPTGALVGPADRTTSPAASAGGSPGDATTQECYLVGNGTYYCDDLYKPIDGSREEKCRYDCGGDPYGGDSGGSDPVGGGGSGITTYYLPSPEDDEVQGAQVPDCSQPSTLKYQWEHAFCGGVDPQGKTLESRIRDALARMKAKGGECSNIAENGRIILESGKMRYYKNSSSSMRGWGHPNIGIIMDDRFVNNAKPYNHDFALAHEIEHYMGRAHISKDSNGVDHTPNDSACS